MNVLIAGNLANMGFEIAKALRMKNVNAKLLIPKNTHQSADPKSMYPELKESGYPEWVITYDNNNRSFGWNNWKLQVIREMRKNYDAIIALTEFSIFAMFAGKPYGALSTGSDMRELAFENSFKGFLYRLSYKISRLIIWGEPDKINLIKKLGISNKTVFCTAPRNVNFKIQNVKKDSEFSNKFVIFHPVSQYWRLKKNDEFLKAFELLCSKFDNLFLIISERGQDLEKAKKILDNQNTKNKYKFVPQLDSDQMQYYYNLSDVVIDQFNIGSIGMITMEAMRLGKPVLLSLDEKAFNDCYEKPPSSLINVNSSSEIVKELEKLIDNPDLCQKIGNENKNWVEENWDADKLTSRYIKICESIQKNTLENFKNRSKLEF